MTSLIKVDNIAPSAGGTEFSLTRGVTKVWANFNGSGTVTIQNSENVSSITDNGTGDYSLNITSSFDYATYVTGGSAGPNSVDYTQSDIRPMTKTASIFRFASVYGSSTRFDYSDISALVIGDLA